MAQPQQMGQVDDIISRWFKALFEEDCVEVMALLRERADLVMEGWTPDDSREVKGSWPNYWMPPEVSKWKGRTALHVGARRGCSELIKQVIDLFIIEEGSSNAEVVGDSSPKLSANEDEDSGTESDSDDERIRIAAKSIQPSGQGKMDTAPAKVNKTDDLLKTTRQGKLKISPLRSDEQIHGSRLDDVQGKGVHMDASLLNGEVSAAGRSKGSQDILVSPAAQVIAQDTTSEAGYQQPGELGRQADNANLAPRLAHSKTEAVATRRKTFAATRLQKNGGRNVFVNSFNDLFYLKDGRYKLDAFAIAVLNGNSDVIVLLADACKLHCPESNRYMLCDLKDLDPAGRPDHFQEWSEAAQKREGERTALEEKKRKLLKNVTKKTISEISTWTPFDEDLFQVAYSKHRDFNFLPLDEFMFHYLVTIPAKVWTKECIVGHSLKRKSVLKLFWKNVMSEPEDENLWKFVLQLQDGQGRTPSHAALDEGIQSERERISSLAALQEECYQIGPGQDGVRAYWMRLERIRRTLGKESEAWKFVLKVVVDGAGRTLLHRAMALSSWGIIERMLSLNVSWAEVVSISCEKYRHSAPLDLLKRKGLIFSVDNLSLANGFEGKKGCKVLKPRLSLEAHAPQPYLKVLLRCLRFFANSASSTLRDLHTMMDDVLTNLLPSKTVDVGYKATRRYRHMEKSWEKDWDDWTAIDTGHSRISLGRELHDFRFAYSIPFYLSVPSQEQDLRTIAQPNLFRKMWATVVEKRIHLPLNPHHHEIRDGVDKVMAPKGFGPAECAMLKGDVETCKSILEFMTDPRLTHYNRLETTSGLSRENISKFKNPIWTLETVNDVSAFHLAAALGNYEMLKACIDKSKVLLNNNIYGEDFEGNNALHYALQGRPPFCTHLLDYVNCSQVMSIDKLINKKDNVDEDLVQRKGCINLLLQTGCDMFKQNRYGEIPYPSGIFKSHPKLLEWWYEKQTKEFDSIQAAMGFAANAISVIAALIGTASYIGPLQPPLGYGGPSDDLQIQIIWIRMFIVCDTLSFYLAVGAIVCSLIPSLPAPQQAMIDELRRTRRMVSLAVAILFPSIILVQLAFVASSIAVINSKHPGSFGNSLVYTTTGLGALIFLFLSLLFLVRFAIIVFPRSSWMKRIYKVSFYFFDLVHH